MGGRMCSVFQENRPIKVKGGNLMENSNTTNDVQTEHIKTINWFLIITNLIVVASTFFAWYGDRGRFGEGETLLDIGAGYVLIGLSVLNIIFALLRKRTPTYVFTALTSLFAFYMISIAPEEASNQFMGSLGFGFYLLIAGIIMLIASHFIFNAIQKKKAMY